MRAVGSICSGAETINGSYNRCSQVEPRGIREANIQAVRRSGHSSPIACVPRVLVIVRQSSVPTIGIKSLVEKSGGGRRRSGQAARRRPAAQRPGRAAAAGGAASCAARGARSAASRRWRHVGAGTGAVHDVSGGMRRLGGPRHGMRMMCAGAARALASGVCGCAWSPVAGGVMALAEARRGRQAMCRPVRAPTCRHRRLAALRAPALQRAAVQPTAPPAASPLLNQALIKARNRNRTTKPIIPMFHPTGRSANGLG